MKIKSLAAGVMLSFTVGNASAGIPVADGIHLAQTIAVSMAEQMMHEMLAEARNTLTEKLAEMGFDLDRELADRAEDFAWDMYKETTEKFGYGWNFEVGNSEIYDIIDVYMDIATSHVDDADFKESLGHYKDKLTDEYRKAEGGLAKFEHLQESHDKELSYKLMQEDVMREINERSKMIDQFRAQAEAVETPQQKEDLRIAITVEQAALANEQMRLDTLKNLMEAEDRTEINRMEDGVIEEWNKITISYGD